MSKFMKRSVDGLTESMSHLLARRSTDAIVDLDVFGLLPIVPSSRSKIAL
jgi:hypothetical protein